MVYGARHPATPRRSSSSRRPPGSTSAGSSRSSAGPGATRVAAIAERVYGGESRSVSPEEWARCWRLFGPRVPGEREKARTVVNVELHAPGLELMRGFDALELLALVDCPTLVCAGELDPATPVAAAREIAAALPAGRARLEIVEGAGHFPWLDVPDRYWPLLSEFVTTTGAGAGERGSGPGVTPGS